ncbi:MULTISPECIES: M18 family aminopeptidase [Clostridium]|uniref:M18 family aminopeptidase n=1 Tax=Clostridium botulinum (strain Eklund 17B / Type B) TaxID=935198 RepID=B2TQJ8_CLOBB|nr:MULTISPECIES: M18 family aminopeptidase [Clostridium]ACD23045.1 probable M18-family aminopeptidase 2 [Clostridium botulinum B str. Eklund 17B (NRP)]MBN1053392.1 M18 family aminopeptidase [Clostridium botulinum]MBY6975633.1 M18 family aminopeptidase [Clostridium botulinum]MBY7001182.1 M18 family aminopeptidase [Clostridium botulinum]MCR1273949.1 M18 family aminopeptidase [Clostridium botulinum]
MNTAKDLLNFINNSKSAFHSAHEVKSILDKEGFVEIKECDKWDLKHGGKYYVMKNESAIIGFEIGSGDIAEEGFRLIGAHTDSPGFRIKPHAEMTVEDHYVKLNTEVYGGAILSTWFDRPLSIAGRVTLKGSNPLKPQVKLVDLNKPVLIIPSLAIHMNRTINEGYEYNKQKDTLPLLTMATDKLEKDGYLLKLIAESLNVKEKEIVDFDLFVYEYEKGCLFGMNEEFISAGRLDDLWMVYAGLVALLQSKSNKATKVLVALDNEEIGSLTSQGANSSLLENILERITLALGKDREDFKRSLSNSVMISADLAHALHPNYIEKHDPTNRPLVGKGPVIKIAASGSYSTDSYAAAIFKQVCKNADVPCQEFVNRSDVKGGTTIGPITASKLNIPVIDMGAPLLSMHSVRELASVKDNEYTIKAFTEFLSL